MDLIRQERIGIMVENNSLQSVENNEVKCVEENEEKVVSEEEDILNDKGFSFMQNLTMFSAIATVAMFILGVALYLAVLS